MPFLLSMSLSHDVIEGTHPPHKPRHTAQPPYSGLPTALFATESCGLSFPTGSSLKVIKVPRWWWLASEEDITS